MGSNVWISVYVHMCVCQVYIYLRMPNVSSHAFSFCTVPVYSCTSIYSTHLAVQYTMYSGEFISLQSALQVTQVHIECTYMYTWTCFLWNATLKLNIFSHVFAIVSQAYVDLEQPQMLLYKLVLGNHWWFYYKLAWSTYTAPWIMS